MTDFSKGAAWMDGEIIPISEAKIGVTDWGFTHADSTYDVTGVFEGGFFRLEDHLDRFEASMKKMRFSIPQTRQDIRDILHQITAKSGIRYAYCAYVVARGPQMVPGSRDPRTCKNHFFAWVVPAITVVPAEAIARGVKMKISTVSERISPHSVDPTAKNYHWGDMTAGLFEALEDGFDTVGLADANGHICEGPGFNIFAVINGAVATARSGVLEGITRKSVLEIAEALGLPVEVRDIPVAEFLQADEVFLSSSGGGPIPIVQVNDRIYGNGATGPVTERIHQAYFDLRRNPRYRTEIDYGA